MEKENFLQKSIFILFFIIFAIPIFLVICILFVFLDLIFYILWFSLSFLWKYKYKKEIFAITKDFRKNFIWYHI